VDPSQFYRIAIDNGQAGPRLGAVMDKVLPFRRIAEAIVSVLKVPATLVKPEEVNGLGSLGRLVQWPSR